MSAHRSLPDANRTCLGQGEIDAIDPKQPNAVSGYCNANESSFVGGRAPVPKCPGHGVDWDVEALVSLME